MLRKTTVLCFLLALSAVARGQYEPLTFGHRYRNQLHGFSLRPPDQARKITGGSTTRLVSWQVRDPKTDAVAWQLIVQQITEKEAKGDLKAYAQKLERTFEADDRFTVNTFERDSLEGKPAIHITGRSRVGNIQFWQRQVRVLAEDGRLLIFTVSGPPDHKRSLSSNAVQIFKTIQLNDPEEFRKRHARNIQRAKDLLEDLKPQEIREALIEQDQWFQLSYKGKVVGWMMQKEKRDRDEGFDGVSVTSWTEMHFQGAPVRRMQRELFVAENLKYERWYEFLQVGTGLDVQRRLEDGMKRNDAISVDVLVQGKLRTLTPRAPEEAQEMYLPKALEALVYRLIDTRSGGGYIFATYDVSKNAFNMHMIDLQSVKRIEINGQSVVATGLTQQKHYDAPASSVWVDSEGRLLKLESEDGFVIEKTTQKDILKRWPRALVSVRQISDQKQEAGKALRKLGPKAAGR